MIKKFVLFIYLCLCINTVYAKDISYPVDTIALEEALKEIPSSKEDAKAELYLYFMKNSSKEIPAKDILKQCQKTVKENTSCMNFILTYNKYLDHANFCFRANNFKTQAAFGVKEQTFQECYALFDTKNYDPKEGIRETGYSGESVYGQCKNWIHAAENCSKYLEKYYTQKLSNSKLSQSDKKYYECLLNKIQTGNMDIPTSKMENDCK